MANGSGKNREHSIEDRISAWNVWLMERLRRFSTQCSFQSGSRQYSGRLQRHQQLGWRLNRQASIRSWVRVIIFSQAMGTASNKDSSYASRLANTAKAAASAGSIIAGHVTQDVSDRVSASITDTVGGKLATAINESDKPLRAQKCRSLRGIT